MTSPLADIDRVVDYLIFLGTDDWINLTGDVMIHACFQCDPQTRRRRVREVLTRLFDEDLMVIGDLGGPGFVDWDEPRSVWVDRALAQLDTNGWVNDGSGSWLRNTKKAEQRAAQFPADATWDDVDPLEEL